MPMINKKYHSYESLSQFFNIKSATLRQRVKRGMSIQEALFTPLTSSQEKGRRRVRRLQPKLM